MGAVSGALITVTILTLYTLAYVEYSICHTPCVHILDIRCSVVEVVVKDCLQWLQMARRSDDKCITITKVS